MSLLDKYFTDSRFEAFTRIEVKEYIVLKHWYDGYRIYTMKNGKEVYIGYGKTKKEIEKQFSKIRMDLRDKRIAKKRESLNNKGINTGATTINMKVVMDAYLESKM